MVGMMLMAPVVPGTMILFDFFVMSMLLMLFMVRMIMMVVFHRLFLLF